MKFVKYVVTCAVVILMVIPLAAEKRAKPVPMTELNNPESPSYVPIPYPKSRKDIIYDLLYVIKKFNTPKAGYQTSTINNVIPPPDQMMNNLLKEDPDFIIGDIVKVKNMVATRPHDYSWLIHVMNKDGSLAGRIGMDAQGLFTSASCYSMRQGKRYVKTNEDILNIMSQELGKRITMKDIIHIDRVDFNSIQADSLYPSWKIDMKNGKSYYHFSSNNYKGVYRIKKKIQWKKDKKGHRPDWRKLVPNNRFLFDTLNDGLLMLERVKN